MPTSADLVMQLGGVATRTLAAAGPRYAPSLDPTAPNLAIQSLQRVASALTLGSAFDERVRDLAQLVRAAYDRDNFMADRLFAGRKIDLQRLAADLDGLAGNDGAAEIRPAMLVVRRHLQVVRKRISSAEEEAGRALQTVENEVSDSDTEEQKRTRSEERDRLQSRLSGVRRLSEALIEVEVFVDGREGDLILNCGSVLLLGQWGTGKTHFLCDFALQSLADGTPALIVLATALPTDIPPLDAIAKLTGLADSGAALVALLEAQGREAGRRSILLIDAINESDRTAWRHHLPRLVRDIGQSPNLGLIVSCRTPFDIAVVPQRTRSRMVCLVHPGFEEQEFDAQLEFFRYYELPSLHIPLLTAEFSRPLFLRLMCEGVKDLSRRSQKSKLRDIAAGQKGMTYVLEHFVKRVGADVERTHGLPSRSCWLIMKGESSKGRLGFAGVLASQRREWLTMEEARDEVQAFAGVTGAQASAILDDMKAAGLLIEHSRYQSGVYVDIFMLPYQRFSDHLVARHLLDEHLDTSSTERLRRCFFRNRRLGAVFVSDRWGRNFAEPGIASALMIEFPERVRRLAERGDGRTELLAFLPKERRLLHPFVDAFLEGLYWRPHSSFSQETGVLVTLLLDRRDTELRSRTYEVLVGLAMRDQHPLGVDWLRNRLEAMPMAKRDTEWSEFVRTVEPESNVHRLLAWAEREDHAKVERQVAVNAIQVAAMLTTTTDRVLRDRATRTLVLIGEAHPDWLFDELVALLAMNDPYISERALAAAYGVCMRVWARMGPRSAFADGLARLGAQLLELVLRPDAPHSTWHALTRGYAIGVLQILVQLRPRALSRQDRTLLTLAPGQARSPFRPVGRIRRHEVEDPEHAIHMDFGNYTIGRLVDGRGNYDFRNREYAGVRRQIADRMRRLGYSTERFNEIDRAIVRHSEYMRDGYQVDRYGKKYSWIAYFEMYGLRCAEARLEDHPLREPRSSDCDIDPSFPADIPEWNPPRRDVFASSPIALYDWIQSGGDADYASLLRLAEVDGIPGDWVLLDAAIHEGNEDGRELRGWVTSVFAPKRSVERLKAEVAAGRHLGDNGFRDPGADFYTYHGEIPWSQAFGSDVRTKSGAPRRVSDRAFDYFDRSWKRGIPIEHTCRRWSWETHHSQLNQVGGTVVPAPPLAVALGLRVVGGSSDMLDRNGEIATIYREAPGPGFGSHFLYIRRDLVDSYAASRSLTFIQSVVGERNINYRVMERDIPNALRRLFQDGHHRFGGVEGLGD
ncbi:MAG: hypothetical protein Q7K25_11360 [Actinomycetota bacterium]|nr:hypothetical protein [Actinomycetota bacterium]